MLWVSLPYLGMFVLAFVLVVVTYPVYTWLLKRVKSEVAASLITTAVMLIALILPIYLFFVVSVHQFLGLVDSVQTYVAEHPEGVFTLQDRLSGIVSQETLQNFSATLVQSVLAFAKSSIVPLTTATITFFVNLTFFVLFIIYFFPAKDQFLNKVKSVLPMKKEESTYLVDRFTNSTDTILKAIVASAFAQSLTGGIMFLILGIPATGFWMFAMFFCAFLPLGAGLIVVPVGIILVLTGNVAGGIILILWHMIAISSVDNIVRGYMFSGGAVNMPELVTFLATLGGLVLFGFFGVIFGPLIAIAFLTALELYQRRRDLLMKESQDAGISQSAATG